MIDVRLFQDPPKDYREVPFWSWNDALEPQEIRRQIALMDQGGWGGFFMHARVGLKTPYMGEHWMECVGAAVDEARQRGMGAWLYDEDKWPSGFAGGLSVTDPACRASYLVCKVDNRPALVAERIAAFSACETAGRLTDIRPAAAPQITRDSDRIIQFYIQSMPLGMPWFNDYTYANLMEPKAVRSFLQSTHERYAQVVGSAFGKTVPGIFTDEPCYIYRGSRVVTPALAIPWAAALPAFFRTRRGYDLVPHLPALFFDLDGCEAIRYDYWRTVTELFVESYTRQIGAWCRRHKLAFTGHVMGEDAMLSQIQWVGAAMPHYPYMHVPGIDKLGRTINEGPGTVLTVKQLDSVVCQLGKRRALCENYGCSGQDFAHTGRKWIGDWAYVLGVTLNNPHLSLYTMRGERKRDYPQVVFYQQPWWPENAMIADYMARLSYVLSQGRRVVDILVIHPIGSAWAVYRPDASRAVDQLDQALDRLLMTLMSNQRDFHLGDELLMGPDGACAAQVVADEHGPRLVLGKMSYRVVIVPPGVTLTADTVRLLHEFAAAGGPVLALEPRPTLINGRPTSAPVLPAQTRLVTTDAIAAALDQVLPFDVRVANRPDIWVHHRRIGNADFYFLANINQERGGVATVHLRGSGRLEEWDLALGTVRPLPSRQRDGITDVVLDFPPVGSHLLVLQRNRRPATVRSLPEQVMGEIRLGSRWQVADVMPNALTLDTAQVRVGDGSWSEPMHILDAHSVVARAGVGSPFALRFVLKADMAPAAPVYLVLESPESFAITVNGQAVSNTDVGPWVDTSFRKVALDGVLQAGHNEIVLRGVFSRDSELESIYLVGTFGVAAQRLREENRFNGQIFDRYAPAFRLTALPTALAAQRSGAIALDLTAHGFPFFAGRVTLRQTVTLAEVPPQAMLHIEGLRAALAHVHVNGHHVGATAWQPHRVDITSALHTGENTIDVTLVGTLRNVLGPHHLSGGDLSWTGPAEFRNKNRWTDDYILVPFGFDEVTIRLLGYGTFQSKETRHATV